MGKPWHTASLTCVTSTSGSCAAARFPDISARSCRIKSGWLPKVKTRTNLLKGATVGHEAHYGESLDSSRPHRPARPWNATSASCNAHVRIRAARRDSGYTSATGLGSTLALLPLSTSSSNPQSTAKRMQCALAKVIRCCQVPSQNSGARRTVTVAEVSSDSETQHPSRLCLCQKGLI